MAKRHHSSDAYESSSLEAILLEVYQITRVSSRSSAHSDRMRLIITARVLLDGLKKEAIQEPRGFLRTAQTNPSTRCSNEA